MLFSSFEASFRDKDSWNDLFDKFSKEMMCEESTNISLRLSKLIEKTSGLGTSSIHRNLRSANFYGVGNKFNMIMFQVAIKEEFLDDYGPDFYTKNITPHCNITRLYEIYDEIKQILRKIYAKEEVEKEDMEFLHSFLHEPWYIGVRKEELMVDLIEKAKYIFKKISENPPAHKPWNIKRLSYNVSLLPKGEFIAFIMQTILGLNSDHLYDLLGNKNDLVWFVIQSTRYKHLLSIFDLLKNILDGTNIFDSANKLKKLCNRSTVEILELLYQRIILGLIYGKNKSKSIAQITNIYNAMFIIPHLPKDSILELIFNLLRKNGHYRIGLKKLIFDLMRENTENCVALATVIAKEI